MGFRYSPVIEALIRRARRRYIANEFLAQGAYALSAGMAGVILLLIAGTQILDWPFLVAIMGGTLALGTFRTLRRVPSAYVIAQLVDRRLFLSDTLSTALFFSSGGTKISASMRDGQRAQAEEVAARADVERAVPFAMPRAVYSLAALGLVASGLFALRYGMSRTLDLRAPLARIVMETFGGAPQEAALRKDARKPRPDGPKPIGLSLPEAEANSPQPLDPAADSALDTIGVPDAVNDPLSQSQNNSKAKTELASTEKADGAQGDSETSEGADATSGESLSDSPQGAKNGKQTADAGSQDSLSQSNSDQNSSLVSKLRDAMSNLLSKMRQQNGGGSQQQSNTGQQAQKPGAQRTGRQNGASGEGQQQANAQQSSEMDGQQASAEGKNGQNSQAQGGGHSADQQGANQPGSGIGRQDGNKDTKLAEQIAAMGKISEIIGKRSASVTGEITVEVPSSQQRLQTPYSQSNATHADAGGEISRDEVPVIFQQYVQQYFEQIRKQPAPKPETTTRSKAQTPATKTQPPSL
ncbi:MAG: hypothetical protein DMG58_28790 [Acidobacteria bacterium]|nr:MAG: hypothetical protein DMG58_28790 [Acidobacteriota bacterium]